MILDRKIPWYRSYRFRLWKKLIIKGSLSVEQAFWLTENVGLHDKKWAYDSRMDTECFNIAIEMFKQTQSSEYSGMPTRLYFKHEEDKVHFVLRWL